MKKHCKGCKFHHNAGHPQSNPLARTHNDWCTKTGKTAVKAIGECKLKNLKKLKN